MTDLPREFSEALPVLSNMEPAEIAEAAGRYYRTFGSTASGNSANAAGIQTAAPIIAYDKIARRLIETMEELSGKGKWLIVVGVCLAFVQAVAAALAIIAWASK